MNNKKTTKILVVIILVLVALILGGLYLLKTSPKMPDFYGQTKADVIRWNAQHDNYSVKIEYVDSEEKEGTVVKQSVPAGEYLGKELIIYLSNGPKEKELPLPETKVLDELLKWAKDNKIETQVEYVETEGEENIIISTNPVKVVKEKQILTIKVSKKKLEEKKEEDNKNTLTKKEYDFREIDYLGDSEETFLTSIKKKGLNARELEPCYSFTIKKGTIWEWTESVLKEGDTISYRLSRGPYEMGSEDFVGMSQNEIKEEVKKLNDLNAHISLSFDENYNSAKKGTAYSCSWNVSGYENIIECNISLGVKPEEETPVIPSEPEPEVEKTAYIPAMNVFESMVFNTANDAINYLKTSVFKDFTNVTYNSNKTRDYLIGSIYEISVNGNTAYEPGQYAVTTSIIVNVSEGY